MKKIYFIEGLPGSGKTTMVRKLSEYLKSLNKDVVIYNEGDLHPVDLAWIAILKKEELDLLINRYPSLEKSIRENIKQFEDKLHLAYTKVKLDIKTKDFGDYCSKYEIYKTEDVNDFIEEHLSLWKVFLEENKDNDKTFVFECIFMQNHINELLLKYDMSMKDIIKYYERFQEVLEDIEVLVIYIKHLDIDNTLTRITEERRTNDKSLYKDWIDLVTQYFEETKYGKVKGYVGYHGALKYFKDRQNIELEVLDKIKIDKKIVSLDKDYDEVFNEIIKDLKY
jgi:hypothetical protein